MDKHKPAPASEYLTKIGESDAQIARWLGVHERSVRRWRTQEGARPRRRHYELLRERAEAEDPDAWRQDQAPGIALLRSLVERLGRDEARRLIAGVAREPISATGLDELMQGQRALATSVLLELARSFGGCPGRVQPPS